MSHDNVTRRRLLRGVGAGVALGGMVGTAGAQEADDYIVGVRNQRGVEQARGRAESVKRVLDFDDIGKAVAGRFTQEALDALENNPNVQYVEEDGEVHAIEIDSDDPEVPWGVDRVDAEKIHSDETGSGAEIAIIDTGVDYTHIDLDENYVTDPDSGEIGGYDFVNEDGDPMDDNGHGTHCAGIAAAEKDGEGVVGVAPAPDLYGVKVLDSGGSGSYSDVAAGIKYVADEEWDVGSLSLGGSSSSQTLKDACSYAYNNGVLLVAAAGNDGPRPDSVKYPAKYDTVIAVSATTRNDSLPRYSSRGPEVELAAPGNDIESTLLGGGYGSKSGTSMACPHVSGAGGLVMANGYSNIEARQQLRDTAEDIGLDSDEQGHGLLDAEVAGDTTAPTAPSNLSSPSHTDTTVDLDWDSSSDSGTGVDHYNVYVDGNKDRESSDTTETVDSLSPNTNYDFYVTAVDGAGNESGPSNTIDVTTDESTSNSPAIDTFSISNKSNGGWARFDVDWAVSDSDGDLSQVELIMEQDGTIVDSVTNDVSGGSASGTDRLEEKKGSGTYDITLTVRDQAGNTTSKTKTRTA